jgi:hypothetical protein
VMRNQLRECLLRAGLGVLLKEFAIGHGGHSKRINSRRCEKRNGKWKTVI